MLKSHQRKEEKMEFGEKIKEVRTRNNLTQEQFATQLHVTRQAVSNWENNRNLPDLEMLIAIATIFELSLDELILGGTQVNKITEKLNQRRQRDPTRQTPFDHDLDRNIFTTIRLCLLLHQSKRRRIHRSIR